MPSFRRVFALLLAVSFSWHAAAGQKPRVILISVDGLRPDAITAETAPNMAALRDAGAHAERALNDLPSVTLPNHTSMLTGVSSEVHGVLVNTTIPGHTKTPTVFHFTHNAGLRCAFFATKEKLNYLAPPDDVETTFNDADMAKTTSELLTQLSATGPDLIFLHLREPDSTGHAKKWMSPEYLEAVGRSDEQIGRIREAVGADLSDGAGRPTYIIITADHGGDGLSHAVNIEQNRRIPWIVAGPGIAAGRTLTQDVTTLDTAPTVLFLLGIPTPANLPGVARSTVLASVAMEETEQPASRPSVIPPAGNACIFFAAPLFSICAAGLIYAARASHRHDSARQCANSRKKSASRE